MNEVMDTLRWANAFMSLLCAIGIALRARRKWSGWEASDRRIAVAVSVLLAVSSYGSIEAYLAGTSNGWRVPAFTIALLGVMHGLLTETHQRRSFD